MYKVPIEVLEENKQLIQTLIDIIYTYKLDLNTIKNNAEKQVKLLEDNYHV